LYFPGDLGIAFFGERSGLFPLLLDSLALGVAGAAGLGCCPSGRGGNGVVGAGRAGPDMADLLGTPELMQTLCASEMMNSDVSYSSAFDTADTAEGV